MSTPDRGTIVGGYMLLPPSQVEGYQGVDRCPFEPTLPEFPQERTAELRIDEASLAIWRFHPCGWTRDACRLYEENLAENLPDDLFLVSSETMAHEIQRMIEPHLGRHEVFYTEIFDPQYVTDYRVRKPQDFCGFDIAYPGGDHYSAILNGVFVNGDPQLMRDYGPRLNNCGLFTDISVGLQYLRRFSELVLTETDSEFRFYALTRRN